MGILARSSLSVINVNDGQDGQPGAKGDRGISVTKTREQWFLSTSNTALSGNPGTKTVDGKQIPVGTWTYTEPSAIPDNYYLWGRLETTMSDTSVQYSDAVYRSTIAGLKSEVDKANQSITNKVWQTDLSTTYGIDETTITDIRDRVTSTQTTLDGITSQVLDIETTSDPTTGEVTYESKRISTVEQTADKIGWVIKDGSTSSSVQYTANALTAMANQIDLTGKVTFNSMDTSLKNRFTTAESTAETALDRTNIALETIIGTQTSNTYHFTGTSQYITELTNGLSILYLQPRSVGGSQVAATYRNLSTNADVGTNGAVLNLTLADGTQTGEIPVWYQGVGRLTSHFSYGSSYRLTYYKDIVIDGSYRVTGWFVDAQYNSDTVDNRIVYFTGKTGAVGIWAASLFMRDGNGTYQNICTASDGTVTTASSGNGARTTATTKKANTHGFEVGSPIWYTSTSYNANTNIINSNVIYSSYGNVFDSRYSFNTTLTAGSLTSYANVYLVGTINATDGLFYLDSTWWTQAATDPAKVYILVGGVYDSTTSYCRITLYEDNPWLVYKDGKLQDYTKVLANNAQADANTANNWINSNGATVVSAADIVDSWKGEAVGEQTTINGGLIQTNTILAKHLATNAIMSQNYSSGISGSEKTKPATQFSYTGSFLDLKDGNFYTPNFGVINTSWTDGPDIGAFINGRIIATSGTIGSNSTNYWQIGNVYDYNNVERGAIIGHGSSYIQAGNWQLSNDRLNTQYYSTTQEAAGVLKYYKGSDNLYYDVGLKIPTSFSTADATSQAERFYRSFFYARKASPNNDGDAPSLDSDWTYLFMVDKDGNVRSQGSVYSQGIIYENGQPLSARYAGIGDVEGNYVSTTGGSITGSLTISEKLTVKNLEVTNVLTGTASAANQLTHSLTINNQNFDGSADVVVSITKSSLGLSNVDNTADANKTVKEAGKVTNSLKIQLNSGTTEGTNQFTYNGSAAKNINITKSSIGLGNVENTALSTWTGSSNLTTAKVGTLAAAATKGVDASIATGSTSTNLPTSEAVASFVEGKGYVSSSGVTSVRVQATSPVVSSTNTAQTSTLNTTISLANAYGDTKNPYGTKTANYVLAGPSSGNAAAPTFRALVAADIPSITKSKISDFPTTWALSNVSGADDLKAIEALSGTSGMLKKTAANTWALTTVVAGLSIDDDVITVTKSDGTTQELSVNVTGQIVSGATILTNASGQAITLGDASHPVYFSNGVPAKANVIPTISLNGTATTAASLYAPTAVGTSGQILKSNGSGAPTWVNQSTLSVGSATSATSATTATKFSSSRTIALTGDVTGSASGDGSSGWSVATTVGDNSHNHDSTTIVPIETKTYTGVIASANDVPHGVFVYATVRPTTYATQWHVKYKMRAYVPGQVNYNQYSVIDYYGYKDIINFHIINTVSTSLCYHNHWTYKLKEVGFNNGYGHALATRIYSSTNPTSSTYARTFEFELMECSGCTLSFLDEMTLYSEINGTGTTNYNGQTEYSYSNGLQETGDNDNMEDRQPYLAAKTGSRGIWATSLLMETGNGTYENICTASDGTVTSSNRTTATTKIANTTGFRIGGSVYYSNTTYNANSNISTSYSIFNTVSAFDSRYTINSTLTANFLTPYTPFYLVGTIGSDGLFYLDSTWWTQTPTTEGKVYILVGGVYDSNTSNCRIALYQHNPWFYYDGTKLVRLSNHALSADSATNDADGNPIDSTYLKLSGGTMTGDILFTNSGTTTRQIRGQVGGNDYWRIAGGATASNAGWFEIATGDDSNEPIYARQYSGAFTTLKRTMTLLDASGNTSIPGTFTINTGVTLEYDDTVQALNFNFN